MHSPSLDLDLAAEHKADLRGKRMRRYPFPKAQGDDSRPFGLLLVVAVGWRPR